MINSTIALAVLLPALVLFILRLGKAPSLRKIFHYLPAPFWCYFVPMLMSTFGLLPEASPVYTFITTYVLCACLFLLLLNVNLPAVARVGPAAAGAMLVGSAGITAGAILGYALCGRWLPADTWKSVGAISASWTGGSANMLAVKEALQMSDSAFAPLVIVDTLITYAWMGFMIALAPWQNRWDAWVKADRESLVETAGRLSSQDLSPRLTGGGDSIVGPPRLGLGLRIAGTTILTISALLIGWGALALGRAIPWKGTILSSNAWAFILVSLFGIAASLTPARQLERLGAARAGTFLLYVLLAAIGARADLQDMARTHLFLGMAFVLVVVHAAFLAAYGYWRRLPFFFLATASQANIGGTASAPIVAGVYQPTLATLGLLLAVGANVYGTYLGLFIAMVCKWIHS